jgi:uncharacterized repeat protein (TIGR01451 family)
LGFAATTAAAPGTYYNNATGQAVDEFVVPTGETAPVTVTPVTPAPTPSTDVSITKRALTSRVKVGDTTGWQLTVRNGSSAAAEHVTVTDVLPLQFRYWKATGGGCAAASTGRRSASLTCDLGTLKAGETKVLLVTGAFVAPGLITNTARVSADDDASPANNVSTASARATGERCTIVGTFGADHLRGTRRHDVVCGLDGADRIDTRGGGRDVVYGNGGRDRCTGDRRDRIYG